MGRFEKFYYSIALISLISMVGDFCYLNVGCATNMYCETEYFIYSRFDWSFLWWLIPLAIGLLFGGFSTYLRIPNDDDE